MIYVFKTLSNDKYLATDKELFDQLIERGAKAISDNDIDELRRVIGQIVENSFTVGTADKSMTLLAGLMKG